MVQIRDRLVAVVLAAGLLLGMAGWQAVGPLLGLATAVLAVVSACAIYRVDPARAERTGDEPDADGGSPQDRAISTPRRAAGRP